MPAEFFEGDDPSRLPTVSTEQAERRVGRMNVTESRKTFGSSFKPCSDQKRRCHFDNSRGPYGTAFKPSRATDPASPHPRRRRRTRERLPGRTVAGRPRGGLRRSPPNCRRTSRPARGQTKSHPAEDEQPRRQERFTLVP